MRAERTTQIVSCLLGCGITLGVVGLCVGPMLAAIVADLPPFEAISWRVLRSTILVAGSIGLVASMLAWVPARLLAGGRRWAWALCVVPVLMPPYLAYSGYGLMRDPTWWIGDQLTQLAVEGHAWVTIGVGRGLALFGLALWAWPMAAIVLAASFSRHGASVDDALRLDAGWGRRLIERFRMHSGAFCAGAILIALVMFGSAVPLHLAQVETLAIELWREMSEAPASQWASVWANGWPLHLVAFAGALLTAHWVQRQSGASLIDPQAAARAGRGTVGIGTGVWLLSVAVPLGLFLGSIRQWSSLVEFWELSGAALRHNVVIAVADAVLIGLAAMALSCFIGVCRRRRSSWVATVVVALWAFAALLPGVLVGAGLARFNTQAQWPGEVLVVVAHLGRFGVVAVALACAMAWSEPSEQRDLRAIDSAGGFGSFRGWLGVALPAQLPVLIGGSAMVGIMGLHEIEATMMVQEPGRGNLAQQILGHLHFSRLEELSAAAAYLVGGGLIVSVIVGILLSARVRAT